MPLTALELFNNGLSVWHHTVEGPSTPNTTIPLFFPKDDILSVVSSAVRKQYEKNGNKKY
jgi:hypothetical protein